jgi:hypothetical protein
MPDCKSEKFSLFYKISYDAFTILGFSIVVFLVISSDYKC